MKILIAASTILSLFLATAMNSSSITDTGSDQRNIASLDTEYQAAVEKNDADTMSRLLADDFILSTGSGKTYSKSDLLRDARARTTTYEYQRDSDQTVRVWGNTGTITAKLSAKGVEDGKPFEYTTWFSDVYVKTASGWKYVFGQSSLPLSKKP